MILSGVLGGIILAWLLTLFDVDEAVKNAFKEFFDKNISDSTYYLIFAVLGILTNIITRIF